MQWQKYSVQSDAQGGAGLNFRRANSQDIAAIRSVIERSARQLSKTFYPTDVIEAALGSAWGVDTQLISDQTYFVAVHSDSIAACGGWSRRKTLFGSDAAASTRAPELLDPGKDAARIRAFFVAPQHARKGIGTALLRICEEEARRERFSKAELVATLSGEPFYRTFGYQEIERIQHPLPNGVLIEFVRMRKALV